MSHKRSEIHARLPENDFLALKQLAVERNITLSDLCREAIKAFLATPTISVNNEDALLETESLISDLESALQNSRERECELKTCRDELLEKYKNLKDKFTTQEIAFNRLSSELSNQKKMLPSPLLNDDDCDYDFDIQGNLVRVTVAPLNLTSKNNNENDGDNDEEINWI
jgi:hypothetical protein